MNKVSSKHHWENVWKFSNNKESYNFPPSRIERAKDKLKTFIYNEYYFSPGDKILEAGCGASYSNLLRNIKLKDMVLIFLKMQKVLQLSI